MVILMEAMMDGNESARSHILGTAWIAITLPISQLIKVASKFNQKYELLAGLKGMYLFYAHHLQHFPHAMCDSPLFHQRKEMLI